jgi:hypothetical protein
MRALVFAMLMTLGGCAGEESCTEIGCTDDATVTFPSGTVDGPYDLVVDTGTTMLTARCNDPGAPEVADNSAGLQCTAAGFTLEGADAQGHSAHVTITPVGMDPVHDRTEVILSVVEERQPNGPDCPPICYSRTGQLGI